MRPDEIGSLDIYNWMAADLLSPDWPNAVCNLCGHTRRNHLRREGSGKTLLACPPRVEELQIPVLAALPDILRRVKRSL